MYITREYENEAKRLRIPRCIFGAPITLADGRVLTSDGRPLDDGEHDEHDQAEADAQRARDLEFLKRRREQVPAAPAKPQPPPGGAGARIVAAARADSAPLTPQQQVQRDLEAIRLGRVAVQRQADAAVERARRIATSAGARIVQAARTTKGAA